MVDGIMRNTEFKVYAYYLLFLFSILILTFFLSCDSGWSIMDWEVK